VSIPDFLAALSGGDLPADAVREERCIKAPIGCGKPLVDEDGTARVFWDESEQSRYEAEWQITGLCPDCQDAMEAGDEMTEPITSLPDAVADQGALPMPAGPAPLSDAELADYAALDFAELMDADAAAVVARMRDRLTGEIWRMQAQVAELETLTEQATQFRVEGADGAVLVIRRSLSGTWAAIESEARGRRKAWTKRGWRIAAVLADSDVYCWPDAHTAVAEARQAMTVREEGAAS
jgi:hypothetical protein